MTDTNWLEEYLTEARGLCTDISCTTCGAQDFRRGIVEALSNATHIPLRSHLNNEGTRAFDPHSYPAIYLLRLCAFALIIFAILRKNLAQWQLLLRPVRRAIAFLKHSTAAARIDSPNTALPSLRVLSAMLARG